MSFLFNIVHLNNWMWVEKWEFLLSHFPGKVGSALSNWALVMWTTLSKHRALTFSELAWNFPHFQAFACAARTEENPCPHKERNDSNPGNRAARYHSKFRDRILHSPTPIGEWFYTTSISTRRRDNYMIHTSSHCNTKVFAKQWGKKSLLSFYFIISLHFLSTLFRPEKSFCPL